MRAFAELLNRLAFMPSRNGKLALLRDYFRRTPDPDRGWALAALAGELDLKTAKPAMIRALAAERSDETLFAWSYDFVGDLAETAALIWPARPGANRAPGLSEVVEALGQTKRDEAPKLIEGWLDALDSEGRWALLKLLTGGLRIGVSARLAKTALAQFGDKNINDIEELWHGLEAPYEELFAWLEGRDGPPEIDSSLAFRPLMLANPLDDAALAKLPAEDYVAEWKWDGIRVQLVASAEEARLYSRSGDDVSRAFPDIIEAAQASAVVEGVFDGELLVARPAEDEIEVAPFNELQQRLNRKTVSAKLLRQYPAHLRLYDILFEGETDLRALCLEDRRMRLEQRFAPPPARFDLSPQLRFETVRDLAGLRASARGQSIEGLMLKRKDSPYLAGRPKGPWFKWKRDPLLVDCVLMYAQRGHGKRSSFYSDYTFGCWRDGEGGAELVPVGKAYFGFTDAELKKLDKWVRDHTTERFGPVRAVEPGMVLEVAFDAVHPSTRHKSGLAMRFPRVHRIRWDKPAHEADRVESLEKLVEGETAKKKAG
jgi:DNA ligase-1